MSRGFTESNKQPSFKTYILKKRKSYLFGCAESLLLRGPLSRCSKCGSLMAGSPPPASWFTCFRAHGLQQLWLPGPAAPQHVVGSSWTRDRTRVLCIGRRILNHWTTREVPRLFFQLYKSVTAALSLELKPPTSRHRSY